MTRYVEEIMQKEVVTVAPETDVRELLRRLVRAQISGLPVVTEEGDIVGVVSTTDVVRLAAGGAEVPNGDLTWEPLAPTPEEVEEGITSPFFMVPEDWHSPSAGEEDVMQESPLDDYTVADIMTPAVFTVRPRDTVEGVAKFLLQGRIHRALVVEDGQLKGIVTTFDLLRALVERGEG